MPDTLDLTGAIAGAINGSAGRGRPVAVGYIDENGAPQLSFRGSTQVLGPQQLAIWARKQESGFAKAIATNPAVGLVYFGPEGPGPVLLRFSGTAVVDPSANDTVYGAMIQGERDADPDRNGVAVVIDVNTVFGGGADGPIEMVR